MLFPRSSVTMAIVMSALASVGLLAQATTPRVVPVEREPQHHRVFANAVLAVLDVRFPPSYVSLFHTHSHDNVSVRIETGPTRIDTRDAAGTPQTAAVGRVVFNSATPPYTHRVANLGPTTIRILDVEILGRAPAPAASGRDDLAGHDIVIDNGRVRISRIIVAPGAAERVHSHARGWLEVTVRGATPGAFRWHEAGARVAIPAGGPAEAEIVEIEVK
jgi:hypothetical protein